MNSSHSTTPKLHTSHALEYGSLRSTSGAVYCAVPTLLREPWVTHVLRSVRLRPKSDTLISRLAPTRRLAVLRSRWMMGGFWGCRV